MLALKECYSAALGDIRIGSQEWTQGYFAPNSLFLKVATSEDDERHFPKAERTHPCNSLT